MAKQAHHEQRHTDAARDDVVVFQVRLKCVEFQELDFRHPLAFAQEHLSGFNFIHNRLDAFGGQIPALLGFAAVQCDVGLEQALGEIDDEAPERVVLVSEQRFADKANHRFRLVQIVELFKVRYHPLIFSAQIPHSYALASVFEQHGSVRHHPFAQYHR